MEINQKNLKQSLALIKEIAENKRQQGYYFEKLVKTCLKKIPPYSDRFSQVDLWQDCEVRDGQDIGIDLVAKERDSGKLCAIQCKFYDPKTTLQKSDIDSFLATSGEKKYSEPKKKVKEALLGKMVQVKVLWLTNDLWYFAPDKGEIYWNNEQIKSATIFS